MAGRSQGSGWDLITPASNACVLDGSMREADHGGI